MAYRFRMEKLLRIKRFAEEQSVRQLGQKMQTESECLQRAQALQAGCDELVHELEQPLCPDELTLVLGWIELLSRQLQRALGDLARAREDSERQRAEASRRVCDRQAFERVEQEDRERHGKERRRLERRRLDEAARRSGLLLFRTAEVEHE